MKSAADLSLDVAFAELRDHARFTAEKCKNGRDRGLISASLLRLEAICNVECNTKEVTDLIQEIAMDVVVYAPTETLKIMHLLSAIWSFIGLLEKSRVQ
jgi:hypothetical protein